MSVFISFFAPRIFKHAYFVIAITSVFTFIAFNPEPSYAGTTQCGIVLGDVYDAETGTPMENVKVTVFERSASYDQTFDYGKQTGTTDSSGAYEVAYPWTEVETKTSLMGGSISMTLLTDSVRARIEAPNLPPGETDLTAFGFTRMRTPDENKQGGLFGGFSMPSDDEIDWGTNPRLFLPRLKISDDGGISVCEYEEMFGFTDILHSGIGDIGAKGMVVSFRPVYPKNMNFIHLKMRANMVAVRKDQLGKTKPILFDAADNGKGGDSAKGDGIFTTTVKIKNFVADEWMIAYLLLDEANFLVNDGSFKTGDVLGTQSMSFFQPKTASGGTFAGAWGELTGQGNPDKTNVFYNALGKGVKVIFAMEFTA